AGVLEDPLVVGVHLHLHLHHAEGPVLVLGDVRDGRALVLGQIAEEGPHHAVALLGGVGVHSGLARDGAAVGVGGNPGAHAVRVELPAVVGAGDAVAAHRALGQRAAAVDAQIRHAHRLPGLVAV